MQKTYPYNCPQCLKSIQDGKFRDGVLFIQVLSLPTGEGSQNVAILGEKRDSRTGLKRCRLTLASLKRKHWRINV